MVYKGLGIVCHYEQSTKTQRGIIYMIWTGVENSTIHDMHALPFTQTHTSAYQCTCTHANTRTHFLGGDGIQYVLRAAVLLCRLAGTFVMVVLLFHIKQNATALHTAPLISASVPQPFIIASHPLLLSSSPPLNVALIAALHQAVLLRMIQASPG